MGIPFNTGGDCCLPGSAAAAAAASPGACPTICPPGPQGPQGPAGPAGGGASLAAEFVQHTQAPNNSRAPGDAIMYETDNPGGVYNTIGITTTTRADGGTEFLLPVGTYIVDFENSADAAWSLAIYKSVVSPVVLGDIDTNTIAGASTATTWIHGRAIIVAAAPTFFIISPVTGTQGIPTAGTAAGEFIARLTVLKIA